MEQTDRIVELLEKYALQDISPEELAELRTWGERHPAFAKLLFTLTDGRQLEEAYLDYKKASTSEFLTYDTVWKKIHETPADSYRNRFKKWLYIAASLLIVGTGIAFLRQVYPPGKRESNTPSLLSLHQKDSILPGTTKAQLVLNTGKSIQLSGNISDVAVHQGKVTYTNGSNLTELPLTDATMHTLIVPKGGEFKMKLPDGSMVWLNASSILKFPSRFSAGKREVELIGEAYFEVYKNEQQPFLVKSRQQEVKVLGTSFNVKAYQDDQVTTTTLVEGKVSVSSSNNTDQVILLAGEEANMDEQQQLKKYQADVDRALSWQRGEFVFNRTSVYEVMKQISRWYNVEVVYSNGVPNEYFTGQLNRSVDFEVVLQFLKESGINYRMQARKITIL